MTVVATTVFLTANSTLNRVRKVPDPFSVISTAHRLPEPFIPARQDFTLLVGGVDTPSQVPATGSKARSSVRGRADTLVLVRLVANGRGAYVASISRDSWVPIPGYGAGKVNRTYNFGRPSLAVRAADQLTNVRIKHAASTQWVGFRDVTNALGAVSIDIPVTSYESKNQVMWTKGICHLSSAQAASYVRDSYGLANGSSGWESAQQDFLWALFGKIRATNLPGDSLQTHSLLRYLYRAVSVDNHPQGRRHGSSRPHTLGHRPHMNNVVFAPSGAGLLRH